MIPISLMGNVETVLAHHYKEIELITNALPLQPIECECLIQVQSVRDILVNKHQAIIDLILTKHASYCKENIDYLEAEFRKIIIALSKDPENIEELQIYRNILVESVNLSHLSMVPSRI